MSYTGSKFDTFRNELIGILAKDMEPETIGKVLSAFDRLSGSYDVIDRETALVRADERLRELAVFYLGCARQDGKSKTTIGNYSITLRQFCDAMRGRRLEDIGMMDIRRYLMQYQADRGVSMATLEHKRIVLSSFFGWLHRNEYIAKNPCSHIDKIKYAKKSRTAISGEDVARLRNACETMRQRVIVEVLVGSGLRVSELAGLKMGDIDFRENSMTVFGKGSKYRTAYLSADAVVAIEAYAGRGPFEEQYLIRTSTGGGVSSRTIQREIRTVADRAHIDTDRIITPHVLRHTFATGLVNHGCPITSVQAMLGHSSINTTMVYTHISNDNVHQDFMKHGSM